MTYQIRRVDRNQNLVVKKFRALGCKVAILSSVGQGMCDLLVMVPPKLMPTRRPVLALVEVKDGSKPPSARKLTDCEAKFHEEWRGCVFIINSEEEAEDLVKILEEP